ELEHSQEIKNKQLKQAKDLLKRELQELRLPTPGIENKDNIPGVGSYNLLGDHHGPIKDLELNRTRSLNRLDHGGRTYKDIGYRLPDNNEMHRKLKEAQDQIKSLDILLTGANKQKDMSETK
ncbi:CAP-Gly domain-containing linker protein 1, partial [Biomphalaria glabrata]